MTTALDEIKSMFDQLKMEIEDLITRKVMVATQMHTLNGLSDISKNLGLIRAGEFRSGNNVEPGQGFSGVRIAYPSMSYESQQWNIAGLNNDRLQFGISADDGSAFFSQGAVQMNENGITSDVYNKLVTFDGTSVEGWLGGSSVHGYNLFGIFHKNKSGETLVDDFEDGTLAAWTSVGNPSVYEESANADGTYSCLLRRDHYITKSITTSASSTTPIVIKLKARAKTVDGASAGLAVTLGGSGASGAITLDTTWQEYIFMGMADGANPSTLTLRPTASGDEILVDDIYYDNGTAYSFVGSASDGPETLRIDASSTVIIGKQNIPYIAVYVNEFWMYKKNILVNQGTGNNAYMYFKDNYMIFRWLDGATTRYKYLDMSGTGVTWVHSTTEP